VDVKIEVKKANSFNYQLKRSDGSLMYINIKTKKGQKLIEFLKGQ
tara:strand:+ start:147 stop:281 length:135 start_codon:yes stop_codon:yes gene_type:complete